MGCPEINAKIGIALGGGGAKGLAHIGVLKVLEENRIVPDLVAGTSMGALIGAFYCLRGSIGEVERFVSRFEDANLRPYLSPKLSASGLIAEKRVRNFLENIFSDRRIEDLGRPFFCTAVDIEKGEEVVFERGSVVEAIMASISIPIIFSPHPYQGRFLVDGGLVNLVPIDILKKKGAAFTIAVNVFSPRRRRQHRVRKEKKKNANRLFLATLDRLLLSRSQRREGKRKPNMVEALLATFEIMQQRMSLAKLKDDDPDVVINVDTSAFKMYEFNSPQDIIRCGEDTARQLSGYILHELKMLC